MTKSEIKGRWADIIFISWIIVSLIVGGALLRKFYQEGRFFPNGEKIDVDDVGIAEVFSPFWVPIYGVGKLITVGL